MNNPQSIVGTICYIVHESRVLLTQRTAPPHVGQWVAPGGRIEYNETPERCVIREIAEETGLTIAAPRLCGVTTVRDPRLSLHWIAFIFLAEKFEGKLLKNPENPLRWFALSDVRYPAVPNADLAYLDRALSGGPFFQGEAVLGDDGDTFHVG
jgi:8-oxo-dGTP diphosphatase